MFWDLKIKKKNYNNNTAGYVRSSPEVAGPSLNNIIIIEAIISAVYFRCIAQNKPPSKKVRKGE